jgi:hypothetical protein
MQSGEPTAEQLIAAIARLRQGEDVRTVAREIGTSPGTLSALSREIEKRSRVSSEPLRPVVHDAAIKEGFTPKIKHSFGFSEVGSPKSYNPDCVWFRGGAEEPNTVAIFEIDGEVSPKHRAGGATLANLVATRLKKRLLFFAVCPPECERVATATVEIHKRYLAERWLLDSVVIPSFDPDVIRDRIQTAIKNWQRPTR